MSSSSYGCRSCGSLDLREVLDLGATPLANALLDAKSVGAPEPVFPLRLVFCQACSLVQITESVDPERLFCDYPYFSSVSDTMVRQARDIASRLTRQHRLDASSLVIEVASNDGYLLRHYKAAGIPVLGIDPARNIAKVAEDSGIPTLVEFFGIEVANRLRDHGQTADVIHANNVLAHVPDLNGFLGGCAIALKPTGVLVVEVPYVVDLIQRLEFDTIYHEHLCYFSLTAIMRTMERHNLRVIDVEQLPTHGGSLRIVAAPGGHSTPRVGALLSEERRLKADALPFYEHFGRDVVQLRDSLRELLASLKHEGARIVAYGASAKGSTLLNYCGFGPETLDYVVDRSPAKQGYYTPGSHLRIVPPEQLASDMPSHVLLLAWNLADEILDQQAAYRRRGGKFIIPLPAPSLA